MLPSREMWALTEGVRLRMLAVVFIGLLIMFTSLAALAMAGRALGAAYEGLGLSDLWPILVTAAAAVVARALLTYLREVLSATTAARVKIGLRTKLYQHLLALGPGYLERKRTGELVATTVGGVEALETYFGKYLPHFAVTILAPVAIFIYLALGFDLVIAWVFAATYASAAFVPGLFRMATMSLANRHWAHWASLNATLVDNVQGLPTLKAFGQAKARGQQIADEASRLFRVTMVALGVGLTTDGLMSIAYLGGAAALIGLASIRVAGQQGQLDVGSLLVLLLISTEVFRPLRELSMLFHQGMNGVAASRGIFAVLSSRPEVEEPATPIMASVQPLVEFERVTFGYDGGLRPALRDFDLRVAPGETVALVGASGAGKTTVINLLHRYFDPQQGSIRVGGVDLREFSLARLRALYATVSQETYLFFGSVAENLRLARPGADQSTLEAATRAARAHDFILALPNGYDTIVGERGLRLSGGERQRIAIARALLKDAPILLLDEPTSSVDAENEEAIQEALQQLMRGRTTIVIAHRLSTVADADRIVVLELGRAVESGRHADLLAARGKYATLVSTQYALGSGTAA